ncbi:hypothetical protein [Chitinilyticum aquatile]|uniref:hypothetical protein n=1 Tax=Chitinilyticum aquatile TaxID=362520 RepID=UPI000425629C|nr:hypothetical protein [Chitinilyticum aquatile]
MPRYTFDLADEQASTLIGTLQLDRWWALFFGLILAPILYVATPTMVAMEGSAHSSGRLLAIVIGAYSLSRALVCHMASIDAGGWIWAAMACSVPVWLLALLLLLLSAHSLLSFASALCVLMMLFGPCLLIIPQGLRILHRAD